MDPNLAQRLSRIAPRQTLTLTHHGRKTGKPYDVTIWFAVEDDRIFLGTNNTTNWARNVMAKPQVTIKAGAEILRGTVRQLTAPGEREHAAVADADEVLVGGTIHRGRTPVATVRRDEGHHGHIRGDSRFDFLIPTRIRSAF